MQHPLLPAAGFVKTSPDANPAGGTPAHTRRTLLREAAAIGDDHGMNFVIWRNHTGKPDNAASDAAAAAAVNSFPSDNQAQRRTLRFIVAILCASLFLQRFAVPLGSKPFSLVGPVGMLLAAWSVARGTLVFHRARLCAFLFLSACVLAGVAWESMSPAGSLDGGPNLASMAQFLLLTCFAVLGFAEPLDETRFFRTVNFWFAVIAAAGVLQFFAQFAGVRIFAFTGILPAPILYEYGYNTSIPVGVGSLLKSNGFFLIEPSTFSQVMALGLIIEMLAFRRVVFLLLFALAELLSFSGTGWIVLASFVAASMVGMGQRGIALAAATVLLLGLAFGIGSLAAPDFAHAFEQRIGEISHPGTSGHRRFVTPFWALSDTLNEQPSAALIGLGSGVSERLDLPYDYDVNTPIKVALDNGFPALIAYVLLFLLGRKSPIQAALTVPACTLFFFTGAYQQFPPVIFLVLLLISVARLRPAGSDAPARARVPAAIAAI